MKKVYLLLFILLLLHVADYTTTKVGLAYGAEEANIVTRFFIINNLFEIYKFGGIALVSVYLIHVSKRNGESQQKVIRLLKWCCYVYLAICIYNSIVIYIQVHML